MIRLHVIRKVSKTLNHQDHKCISRDSDDSEEFQNLATTTNFDNVVYFHDPPMT